MLVDEEHATMDSFNGSGGRTTTKADRVVRWQHSNTIDMNMIPLRSV